MNFVPVLEDLSKKSTMVTVVCARWDVTIKAASDHLAQATTLHGKPTGEWELQICGVGVAKFNAANIHNVIWHSSGSNSALVQVDAIEIKVWPKAESENVDA